MTQSRRVVFYLHCSYITFPWLFSVRCNLILLDILFICLCSPAELSPIGNKRSPDTREAYVLCIAPLACPPLYSLWCLWRKKQFAELSCPYGLTLPWISCIVGLVFCLLCHWFPPFCDVIFVKQVFQSHEKESENVGVCLNAWFSLIPWLNCPLLWSQCIVVYAQVLRRKVTFVWLAGSPPQWTNPAELVHSATTSWPGGIWPLKWLQKECLSPLQRILFFFLHKVKVTHRVN